CVYTAGIAPTVAARAAHTYSQNWSRITSISSKSTAITGRGLVPCQAVASVDSGGDCRSRLGERRLSSPRWDTGLSKSALLARRRALTPEDASSGTYRRPQIRI